MKDCRGVAESIGAGLEVAGMCIMLLHLCSFILLEPYFNKTETNCISHK